MATPQPITKPADKLEDEAAMARSIRKSEIEQRWQEFLRSRCEVIASRGSPSRSTELIATRLAARKPGHRWLTTLWGLGSFQILPQGHPGVLAGLADAILTISDEEAIRSDWEVTGNDLCEAIAKYTMTHQHEPPESPVTEDRAELTGRI
jgi:hypothetical protein